MSLNPSSPPPSACRSSEPASVLLPLREKVACGAGRMRGLADSAAACTKRCNWAHERHEPHQHVRAFRAVRGQYLLRRSSTPHPSGFARHFPRGEKAAHVARLAPRRGACDAPQNPVVERGSFFCGPAGTHHLRKGCLVGDSTTCLSDTSRRSAGPANNPGIPPTTPGRPNPIPKTRILVAEALSRSGILDRRGRRNGLRRRLFKWYGCAMWRQSYARRAEGSGQGRG
jgi:hypothetical protein